MIDEESKNVTFFTKGEGDYLHIAHRSGKKARYVTLV